MMSKESKTIVVTIMLSVFIVCGFPERSSAIPGISSPGHSNPPAGKTVAPVPPHGPAYIYKWSIADVIQTLHARSIDIGRTEPLTREDYEPLTARGKDAIKFNIPWLGETGKGCIFSFERGSDLKKIRNYYAGLNEKGELYSWSFVKDNILIVFDGTASVDKAKKLKSALDNISK